MIRKSLSFLALILLSACSDAKFAVVNAPQLTYDGTIIKDIAYGSADARQSLDIYVPDNFEKPLPVIVFFHGGRWTFGSKDQYKFAGMTLSQQGYIVVLPNTRLYPQVKHPTFVEDAAKAVAWVHDNISDYGGNRKLYLSGHSSGAHIAGLITADESYLRAESLSPNIINAYAGISGPYDFEPEAEDLKDIFGPPSTYPNMQVTTFIDGNEPPMLLLYTSEDETVHTRNLELLKAGIESKNGSVDSKIYSTGDHVDAVASLSWLNPANLPVVEDMIAFFKKY